MPDFLLPFSRQYFSRLGLSCLFLLLFAGTPALFASCVSKSEEGQQLSSNSGLPSPLNAEVIGIQDGDTIELKFIYSGKKAGRRMGKPVRIRLLHVNCPERGMPFYNNAKQFTSEKCFRKVVSIRHKGDFDKYGRLLGEVILPDGKVLNKELVKKGLAVHFKKYSKDPEYANLEINAKKQKIGIWTLPNQELGHF